MLAAISKKFDQAIAIDEEKKESDATSAFDTKDDNEYLSLKKEIKSSDAYNKQNLTQRRSVSQSMKASDVVSRHGSEKS